MNQYCKLTPRECQCIKSTLDTLSELIAASTFENVPTDFAAWATDKFVCMTSDIRRKIQDVMNDVSALELELQEAAS